MTSALGFEFFRSPPTNNSLTFTGASPKLNTDPAHRIVT